MDAISRPLPLLTLVQVVLIISAGVGTAEVDLVGPVPDRMLSEPENVCVHHEHKLASMGYVGTDDDEPIPYEACTQGIRPGAQMTLPSVCTLNFIFQEGETLFIGTAAHCIDYVGQSVHAQGIRNTRIGEVVFDGWDGRPHTTQNDFALIQIDARLHHLVDPSTCTWGGPTGVGGVPSGQQQLLEHGWGTATDMSPVSRARAHDEFSSSHTILRWNGVGSGGDSGAPILYRDGRAAGIHTAGLTPGVGAVLEQGPTIGRILTLTQEGGYELGLMTANAALNFPVD